MANPNFIQVTLPLKDGSKSFVGKTKQREVAKHLGTFCDNKKLQIRGLKVKAIRIEYEEIEDAIRE